MDADIRLLGPVEVSGPNGPVVWSGARRRSVFALLALCHGRLVSRAALIDALWGDAVPATALKTLQGHVAQVRKGLAAAGLAGSLVTRDPGYLLDIDGALVDIPRFEERVRAGQHALDHGDARAAIKCFETGLALWRGNPLADCPVTDWAGAELTRLHETRALTEELRVTASCRLGHHAEAIGELETLVVRYPLRERLWELLMSAQCRAGRPADALHTYRRVRTMLVDEFGLDPGRELRRLEAAVLAGEPEMDPVP